MNETTWVCLIKITSFEGVRAHMLERPSFVIGRAQEADLPVVIASVSRSHLKVSVTGETISITDQNSANGTFVNGKRLAPGKTVTVGPSDTVKLGQADELFVFQSFPKPFELLGTKSRQGALMASMESLAKQAETKIRDELEKEIARKRVELDIEIAKARKEAELGKTREQEEVQARKRAVEAEIAKMMAEAKEEASREKLKGGKEADVIIAGAQDKIRRDLEESGKRAEAIIKEANEQSARLIQEAESKARLSLGDAREEAARIRLEATDKAHATQREATRKSDEILSDLRDQARLAHEKLDRELSEAREKAMADAKKDIEREREIWLVEKSSQRETLQSELKPLTEKIAAMKGEIDKLGQSEKALLSDIDELKHKLEDANALIARTDEIEARRAVAEKQLQEFTEARAKGIANLDHEMELLREKAVASVEARRQGLEDDLAQVRQKAMEEAKNYLASEEEKYRHVLKMRAVELAQALAEGIVPQVPEWLEEPKRAQSLAKQAIDATVERVMISGGTSIEAHQSAMNAIPPVPGPSPRQVRNRRLALAFCALAVSAGAYFREELWTMLQESQKTSFASTLLEKRRIQSIYSPEQNDQYRDNYTDNILFKRGYFDLKSKPETIEKWTLRLNDLELLRSLKLSEEDIVRFIALETNLVQRLWVLRSSIDAVYLNEGLERMRAAEAEAMAEITTALKTEMNLRKIRELERKFLDGQARSSKNH